MSFYKRDIDGNVIRKKVTLDCSVDDLLTEQSHKDEVNINNIVKRHGIDMIQKVAQLNQGEYLMDDIPTNDFMESMNIVLKAQQTFSQLPSEVRKQFNNQPAEFMDFVQNPDNGQALVDMGLAQRITSPEPITVRVEPPTETPPAE